MLEKKEIMIYNMWDHHGHHFTIHYEHEWHALVGTDGGYHSCYAGWY